VDDSRVVETSHDAGFAKKPFVELWILLTQRERQDLDGNNTAQPCMKGLVDDAHASMADFVEYLVLADMLRT
jgi:hypothetical protein